MMASVNYGSMPRPARAIRQSGRLVKPPSLFVRSDGFTRDTLLREGVAQKLTTHLLVETRLVGLADLTVTESPFR